MTAMGVVRQWIGGLFSGMLLVLFFTSPIWAMHEQVQCQVCHAYNTKAENRVAKELRAPGTAICLSCHDADQDITTLNPPHVMNGREVLAGGAFSAAPDADNAGHNMVTIDATLDLTPPGGASMDDFNCLSCHDAHGNGNYRNLKTEINGRPTWVSAEGDPNYRRNVYLSGMNDFCGACHQGFTDGLATGPTGAWRRHPVGIAIYGAPHADYTHWARSADKITQAEFPSGNPDDLSEAQVFCLSCHRAHGSPYRDALRWDYRKNSKGCLECHSF